MSSAVWFDLKDRANVAFVSGFDLIVAPSSSSSSSPYSFAISYGVGDDSSALLRLDMADVLRLFADVSEAGE